MGLEGLFNSCHPTVPGDIPAGNEFGDGAAGGGDSGVVVEAAVAVAVVELVVDDG